MKKIILSILILTLLSGCFNYKEINDYAIVSGVSIDIDEKDENKYTVGIQIMNAKKDEETDTSLITFYKASGITIYEALERIMLDSPKQLYLGHNEVVVISEDLLKKKDPLEYLDYFMRDGRMEKDSLVMASKNYKAYEILKIITPLETIPSRNLKSTLSVADIFSGSLTVITIDEFISDLINKGAEPTIPSVTITGKIEDGEKMDNIKESDPDSKLKFGTLAYFENSKLKDYLTSEESTGYNFLSNNPKETYVNIKCDDNNYATIRVAGNKQKEKLTFKNNKPVVNVESKIVADLLEYNCSADFIKTEKYLKDLEKKASNKIEKLMTKATNKLYIENKSDILKYGSKFYKRKFKTMKQLGYNRKNILNDITFNLKVDVKIETTELSVKSVKGDTNE